MHSEYSPISLEGMDLYLSLLNKTDSKASDFSFANIWGWAPYYQLEWRFDGTLCWLRQNSPEPCYWAPIGPWEQVTDWSACPEFSSGSKIIRVPEKLHDIWLGLGEAVEITEDRGQWDYLYLSSELSTLSGNRFHKKKNLLKQFQKGYEFDYKSITEDDIDAVLSMQEDWCQWRDCESSETLHAENEAVQRVLSNWGKIPQLSGGIVRIDGIPVAYTIAEPLHNDTLIIHFEKADSNLKGGYQAINWLFCNDEGKKYTYVNREQDLGDEGLRQAKLSYNPVDFVKKFSVVVK